MSASTLTRATDDTPRLETFAATGVWQGGTHTRVEARQFVLDVDEPPAIGGADAGANPIEYVLASLAGCVTVVIQTVAAELDITIGAVEIDTAGTLDLRGFLGTANVSPHFQSLALTIAVTTTAPAKQVEQLKARVIKRCPLFNLITDAGVDITETWDVRAA